MVRNGLLLKDSTEARANDSGCGHLDARKLDVRIYF